MCPTYILPLLIQASWGLDKDTILYEKNKKASASPASLTFQADVAVLGPSGT
jgi:hypothetical protein